MPSYSIGCSWFDAAYNCYASRHSRKPTIMRSSSMSSSMLSTNVGPGENSELRSSPDSDRGDVGDVGDATDVGEPGACGEAEVEEGAVGELSERGEKGREGGRLASACVASDTEEAARLPLT